MRCLLAESSSSSAPKQMRERGRWFPMCGQEKAPPKRGQSSRVRGRWSSATKQFATRGLVPERKAPPKRGQKIKGISGIGGRGASAAGQFRARGIVPTGKAPPKWGQVYGSSRGRTVFGSSAAGQFGVWVPDSLAASARHQGCCRCCRRFEPQAQRRRQSARATMEHGHAGGNLHAAAGSGSAGSQRSGHSLAVRPDHVAGCEGVLTRAATSPRLPSARSAANLGHVRMPLPDSPAQDG